MTAAEQPRVWTGLAAPPEAEGLPHDPECELHKPYVSPATGRQIKRETCQCRHRRELRSKELVEQPLHLSWLHGSLGVVPGP